MTQIKIEVPANDHIALSAMADALQRIAAERTPSVTTGEPENAPNANPEHASRFDVELYQPDEELDESIRHNELFEEAVNTLPDYETSIANFHTEPRVRDAATEQDDTLDADGIPHDKRIHSKGATRLADNTWRLRKRPADKTEEEWTAYIDSVKAELKAVQDIPSETTVTKTVQLNEGVTTDDIVEALTGEPTLDEQAIVDLTPPVIETREGPFYWSHDESDSCGKVETIEELHAMIEGDGLVNQIDKDSYDKRVEIGYDNGVNNVTPNGDVAIEPPVTVGSPVTPVTPPTSLTPPAVETASDKPSVTTFQELMLYMTSDAKKRGADNDMIKATLLEVDPALTAIPLIATRADLIPKFVEALEAKLA